MSGASTTMAWVMPVNIVIEGGMGRPGSTKVWNVPRRSPDRYFTAPISVMAQVAGDPPVVSRSRTQKVTSKRGVDRSSKLG